MIIRRMCRSGSPLTSWRALVAGLVAVVLAHSPARPAAEKTKVFDVKSPNGEVSVSVEAGARLEWSVRLNGETILAPSAIALVLNEGDTLGNNATIASSDTTSVRSVITPINYVKSGIRDEYRQMTLNCRNGFGVIFRVYNDAVAYRFFTGRKGGLIVRNEEANFDFAKDRMAFLPIMWDYRAGQIFNSSFEALYRETTISRFPADSLAFLPVLVDIGKGVKVVILEADLEDYPGMYLNANQSRTGFTGVFAPYPIEAKPGGWGGINYIPTKRAAFIAQTAGTRSFPWRVIAISRDDKELLDNDIVQKLASPPRIPDVSWIKPGQVAWDWWNNWNVSHVDFKAGINTATYKYYIDFASANGIPYIIMDAGWSEMLDLTKVVPAINLREILDYGRSKGVDVILWASWYVVTQQMNTVFPLYAGMGVKGFKIDFVDRDDQKAVASLYEIARKAAEQHLIVDFHGVFKPTGLQRTFPNVISFEGVKGLENYKWAVEDQPRYVVSIPFIRMMAGPMDYTPGAMRNAVRANFRPINDNPMSQGTRCQQLAMYVVFDAPLQMLSDNPTTYMREQECTDFITRVPTTFDETVPLAGSVGEYVALARRKGDTWFVGAMSNWDARDLTIDASFLGPGMYRGTVFEDGINADRDATDYKKEIVRIAAGDTLRLHLAPGGGWAARIEKAQ